MAKKITAEELRQIVKETISEKTYNVRRKKKDAPYTGQNKEVNEGFFDDSAAKGEKLAKAIMGMITKQEAQIKNYLGSVGKDEVHNIADAVGEYIKKRLAQSLSMMVDD